MKYWGKFLFILFCFSKLGAQNSNSFVVILKNNFDKIVFQEQAVYSEKTKVTDIYEVIGNDSLFEKVKNPFLNRGAFHKVHWVKLEIKNVSKETDFIFEFNQTYVDSLQFFVVKGKQVVKTFPKQGLHFLKVNSSNFLSNKYAYTYPLHLKKNEEISVYMRAIVNDGAFRVMNTLWSQKSYEVRKKDIKIRTSYLLVFSGFVGLILILSIAMFVFSRKMMYFYYIGFVLVVFINLLCLRHLISPLIIENTLFFGNNFVEMFGLLQIFFMLMYANEFLSLKKKHNKHYKQLIIFAFTILTIFILGLFLRQYELYYKFSFYLSKILIVSVTLFIYYIAFSLVRKKEKMAYYFVIAYFPLLLFIVHYILTAIKLTTSYNPMQWEYVIFFEISVLAIAMAHKYFLLIVENSKFQNVLLKEKEEGLKAILEAQEKERGRIAKDLHDGVVQQIGSVLLRTRSLMSNLKLIDTKESYELLSSLEKSNTELRTISHQMMPRSLKELGIIAAINDLLDGSLPYVNIKYQFENFNIKSRISEAIEIILYRVLQELIQNVIKHSKATNVSVQLYLSGKFVVLVLEDNGIGIDTTEKTTGIGLMNISSRLTTVNGVINFEAIEEKGTFVTVKIPVL